MKRAETYLLQLHFQIPYNTLWISGLLIAASLTHSRAAGKSATLEYGSFCLRPDNTSGISVPVMSCKPIYDLLQKSKGKTASISDKEEQIRNSQIGTFENKSYVCCAESDVQLNPEGLSVLKKQDCGKLIIALPDSDEAHLSEFPWTVLLIYDDEKDPFKCGGSLITEQYVLTAAHCVRRTKAPLLLKVRLGEHRKTTDPDCIPLNRPHFCAPPVVDVGIAETIVHPNYRSEYNDIALIRLERKVVTRAHIRPICLPIYDNLRNKQHQNYIVTGWGKTETGNMSDVLRSAVMSRVDERFCEDQFRRFGYILRLRRGQMCAAGNVAARSCNGDGGGPMGIADIYNGRPRFIQYGIVVTGPAYCGVVDVPNIYTNVSYNIQWITDNIR